MNLAFWLWLIFYLAVGFLGWRQADARLRPLVAVYLGFYFVTTYIGTVMIGLTDGEVLYDWGASIEVSELGELNRPSFWILLVLPLLVPFLAQACRRFAQTMHLSLSTRAEQLLEPSVPSWALLLAFLSLALAVFAALAALGEVGTVLASGRSDALALIESRGEQASRVPGPFYGLLFITLPMLSFALLWNAARGDRLRDWAMFIFSALVVLILDMLTLQKSILILYLMLVIMAMLQLRVILLKTASLLVGLPVAILYLIQSAVFDDWNLEMTLNLIFLRMASSFPFYYGLYPSPGGEDIPLTRFVYQVMYYGRYKLAGLEGNCPASSHVTAYYQGGLFGATLCVLAISVCLAALARFRDYRGPLGFGVFMQTLVAAYYWTQTSFREPIYSPYGIVMVVPGVALAWLIVNRGAFLRGRAADGGKARSNPGPAPPAPPPA